MKCHIQPLSSLNSHAQCACHVLLPLPCPCLQVHVQLSPTRLRVVLVDDPVIEGLLLREVKAEDSTWFIGE